MAGGKLTPRQKMINLMYLVFIAMLALNMSKEVLSAFGLMNEKFESSNNASKASNEQMLSALDAKASEAKGEFTVAADKAHKVAILTKNFYDYIGDLKGTVLKDTKLDEKTGKLPYESMDKGQNLDEAWFGPSGYTTKGTEIINTVEKYKSEIASVLGTDKKFAATIAEVKSKFDLSKVKNKDGIEIEYLDYHFKGFPAVASLAKLSAWQNDVKKVETDVYNSLLGKAAVAAASYSNYQAIVALDKNVYFQGETVTGKVVLGRYDENTKPTGFNGPGKIVNGQAVLSMTAGAIGEQKFGGQFTFLEDGKTIPLKFEGTYVVVPRPNTANISADKMNVVYRGLPNPMTISFAGISDNNVNANAAGLSKSGAAGKYNLVPASGNEVKVTVSGKMLDGKVVSDAKVFRIKNIPPPFGKVAGESGNVKGSKSRLMAAQVQAELPDFLYDLKYQVTQFTLKVPGQAAVIISGDRVTGQAAAALSRVGRGDQVTIFDIKAKLIGDGAGITVGKVSPVIFEVL